MSSNISSAHNNVMEKSQPFSMEARHLARLMEVSLTLNSTLNIDDLLQYIISVAIEVLECEAASLLLYDEKHELLFFAASSSPDVQKMAEMQVPLDGSLAGTIFREGQVINLSDVRQDPRHFAAVSQQLNFEVRSFLGVPMHIRDKGVGVLEALNHRGGNFSQTEERLLSVLASQAAIAIYNARLISDLEKAYRDISETDQLKSRFLSLASHELRTPLGIIIGYATFLQDGHENGVSENAERVLKAAEQMHSVIDAMTSLQKLEAKSMLMNPRNVPIQHILADAYTEMLPQAREMGQTARLELPAQPLMVTADPDKLTPAFINIINNAIRFTPRGGSLTVGASQTSQGIAAWVSDNGIGLAANQLTKIFQEFYQVEPHDTRHYSGLGVGLTIARGLIEMQGGHIWAESAGPGRGTVIRVLMPPAGAALLPFQPSQA